ncbi:Sodium/potassium-transporting ATPase subunit alpha-A [Escovopsis weberi]|uniref:Sodium/potassium-transporting ATPase subunit alpha-A n=1 Tax=Escovopsis weberi TaxID=150374 RepID=A0A0M8MZD6_ESCWE|nr:Sodium/potassium-transporting ATPase subunit alpha-A [Escovopsis weberi]
MHVGQIAKNLDASPSNGLSNPEAARRLQQNGPNAPAPPKTNKTRTAFGYFFGGFGSILLAGSILVFVSWRPLGEPPALANLALAVVMLAVFFIQAAFAMYQDWSTSKVMSSIKDMLPAQCDVLRSGERTTVLAKNLVMGDVLFIRAGNKLAADVRFIETSFDARFDRSVLTGESVPVAGSVACTDQDYLETLNIGLQGTHCINGYARGIVVATGDATVFGRVVALTNEPKQKLTTLEREVRNFVWLISIIMAVMITAVVVIWAGWLRVRYPRWINVPTLIVDCVSVAVAFIPEGLPIAITAGLTITAGMMRKNNILCKSLKTVETLGAVSVICSDKTGTLTTGNMTVTECVVGLETLTAEQVKQQSASQEGRSAMGQLVAVSALCNAAERDSNVNNEVPVSIIKVIGDATDTAIFRFVEDLQRDSIYYFRGCWSKVFELAFSSKYKFMLRCFRNSRPACLEQTMPAEQAQAFRPDDILLTVKGGPDVLMPRCTQYVAASGAVLPFDAAAAQALETIKNRLSSQGRRCLVVAQKTVTPESLMENLGTTMIDESIIGEAETGLTLIGVVAIVDPLRPEINHVVSCIRQAGIRVLMVTGDFALTAIAVAREAGIVTSSMVDDASALLELNGLSDHQWEQLTKYEEIVFARTTPEQKLKIVQQFQKDHVVAMTGDGVNDAPSLKAADVGICVGNGSDIAMEAADMVLLVDFISILSALRYGRVVFDNLKKVIAYLLPAGSFSEFWPVMTSVIFGLPQILSSFLMIVICCLTDCLAATMLSFEAAEADVLLRRPRDLKMEHLVDWRLILHAYGLIGLMETLASFAMSYWYLQRKGIAFKDLFFSFGKIPEGIDPAYYNAQLATASSIYFVNLVVMQWFNLLATRTRRLSIFQHPPLLNEATKNLCLFPAMLFAFVMAILFLHVPQAQAIIGTSGVPVKYWFLPIAFGITIILIDEARRYFARQRPDGIVARLAW